MWQQAVQAEQGMATALTHSLHPWRRWALLLLHCLLPSFLTGRKAILEPRHRDIQIRTQTLHLRFKQQVISVAHSLVTKAKAIRDTIVSRREVKSIGTHGCWERSKSNCFQMSSKQYFAKGKPQTHYQMWELPEQQLSLLTFSCNNQGREPSSCNQPITCQLWKAMEICLRGDEKGRTQLFSGRGLQKA